MIFDYFERPIDIAINSRSIHLGISSSTAAIQTGHNLAEVKNGVLTLQKKPVGVDLLRVETIEPFNQRIAQITLRRAVPDAFQITNAPTTALAADGSYTYTPAVVGGLKPYEYFLEGELTDGFEFNSVTGVLSKTPDFIEMMGDGDGDGTDLTNWINVYGSLVEIDNGEFKITSTAAEYAEIVYYIPLVPGTYRVTAKIRTSLADWAMLSLGIYGSGSVTVLNGPVSVRNLDFGSGPSGAELFAFYSNFGENVDFTFSVAANFDAYMWLDVSNNINWVKGPLGTSAWFDDISVKKLPTV